MSNSNENASPTSPPTISVVIPTHNNAALLSECLQAVRRLDYPAAGLSVVVVDNGSTDRTREMLARRFASVQVVPLEANMGFAAACNKGAQAASGEYIAFLNNDAIPDPQWLNALLAAMEAGPQGTVCSASRIMSRDGTEVEYDGAGSNLFAAGRPHSTWGWPDMPEPPGPGTPVLFASGGAMLVRRSTFLEVGGFDSEYFAYFEDVDLGWRLWLLGHAVVYAPDAVVRHIGGATGRRAGAHRRYVLWESNSLATVIKNYQSGNMERILSVALLLEYKRALMSMGDAVNPSEYELTAPKDTNKANVERLPKVSVAHLAAIDRLNAMLPHLMRERERVQALRRRSDAEILPLLGRLYAPQFAGPDYARDAARIASAIGLFDLTNRTVPPRVLIVTGEETAGEAAQLAAAISPRVSPALALIEGQSADGAGPYTVHSATPGSTTLRSLLDGADVVLAFGESHALDEIIAAGKAVARVGPSAGSDGGARFDSADVEDVMGFCLRHGAE
jgi:GT2 family glycosyltransferase